MNRLTTVPRTLIRVLTAPRTPIFLPEIPKPIRNFLCRYIVDFARAKALFKVL